MKKKKFESYLKKLKHQENKSEMKKKQFETAYWVSIFSFSKNLNWINKINKGNNKHDSKIYLRVNIVYVISE